jgi:4-amino-4-deoxy-L-arabinose transferase-like glycosyltransferase
MNKQQEILFYLLVALFLTFRLASLFTTPCLYDNNELLKGTIAKEIIDGKKWSIFDFHTRAFEGGSAVMGIITAFFFLVFGESIYTLKLAPLTVNLFTFIFWLFLTYRYFGFRCALLTGILFILSPPNFVRYSMINKAAHYESTFFTVLTLLILYKIFFPKTTKLDPYGDNEMRLQNIPPVYIFLLGIVSGFGLYFGYIYIITIITFFFLFFVLNKIFFSFKNLLLYVCSFLIGFSPWILFGLRYKFINLYHINAPFLNYFSAHGFLGRMKQTFISWLGDSFAFSGLGLINTKIISYFYLFLFMISFFGLIFANWNYFLRIFRNALFFKKNNIYDLKVTKILPILAFIILFFIGFLLTDVYEKANEHKYKFFFPLYPFIFTTIALFLIRLFQCQGGLRKIVTPIAATMICLIISIGFFENLNLIKIRNFGKLARRHLPYSYNLSARHLYLLNSDVELSLKMINMLKKEKKMSAYVGLIFAVRKRLPLEFGYFKDLFGKMVEEDCKPDFYRFMTIAVCHNDTVGSRFIMDLMASVDKKYRDYCYEGLGYYLVYAQKFKEVLQYSNDKYLPSLYRGLGMGIANNLYLRGANLSFYFKYINMLDEPSLKYLYEGMGCNLGFFEEDIPENINNKSISIISRDIPSLFMGNFYNGLGMRLVEKYGLDFARYIKIVSEINEKYKCDVYRGIGIKVAARLGNHGRKLLQNRGTIKPECKDCYYQAFQDSAL